MITFIFQDIVACILVSFTVGLYVGAFIQRRRDLKEFELNCSIVIKCFEELKRAENRMNIHEGRGSSKHLKSMREDILHCTKSDEFTWNNLKVLRGRQ